MIWASGLAREFWEQGRSASLPIYDLHGHMGTWHSIYFPRAEAPDMIRTMDECGVRLLVFSHHAALTAPNVGNRLAIEAVRRYPERLRAYCAINPNYPELVESDLESFDSHRDVYAGFKFHAGWHQTVLTAEGYRPAWEYADRRELPVLLHTWSQSPHCGPVPVRQVAEHYPGARILLGHCFHPDWDAAVALLKDCPNCYLDLTALCDDRGPVEKFVAEVGSERIFFGTDLPWFDPHQAMGMLLSAAISDEDRHNICHRNAEKLLKISS